MSVKKIAILYASLKIFPLALLLQPVAASAQQLVPPEVVRLENVQIEGDVKTVYVGNTNKQ
jgi:hypothetical protein